jgi:hypothetical protein
MDFLPGDTLLIIPTRGRPDSAVLAVEAALNYGTKWLDICLGLDDDDVDYPEYRTDRVIYERNPRMGMNGTLNFLANKYADRYKYLAFMGDDHRPRTPDWDEQLIQTIADFPNGIAYGNDLIQGENLPTAVLLDSNIVRTLGYMAPPEQKHLYLDDFWRDLGRELGTLRYNPHVVIEHMHFSVGKSEQDAQYAEVNSAAMYDHDRIAYEKYVAERRADDIRKLRDQTPS